MKGGAITKLSERLQHGFNAFKKPELYPKVTAGYQGGFYARPDRPRMRTGNERSLLASVLNRIAIDVAAVSIQHARVDENGRFTEVINSGLNNCLTMNANRDQTGREFVQDIVMSLCDEGCIAVVITSADIDPAEASFKIETLRVGKILEWYPEEVKVEVYNEDRGIKEPIIVQKRYTAIIENPLYSIMNEPNSTLRRLIHKLNILDSVDEQSSAGKLDMIVQVPYMLRSPSRREYAESRRKEIETQLAGSKYGIAYTDGTEHIVQLNRPIENNLMNQIEYLTKLFYNQLGMSEAVFDGTADEEEMINYYNRTIEPYLAAIANAFKWKFLTKTARSQGQDILYFRDPFKLVPAEKIADIADKLTRNEILSSNEVRAMIGYKPSKEAGADALRNKNLNQTPEQIAAEQGKNPEDPNASADAGKNQNGSKSSGSNFSDIGDLIKSIRSSK